MTEKVLDLSAPQYEPLRKIIVEGALLRQKMRDEVFSTSHMLIALIMSSGRLHEFLVANVGLDHSKLLLAHKNSIAKPAAPIDKDYDFVLLGPNQKFTLDADLARGLSVLKAEMDSGDPNTPFELKAFFALASLSLVSYGTLTNLIPDLLLHKILRIITQNPKNFYSNPAPTTHPAGTGTRPAPAPPAGSNRYTTGQGNPLTNFATNLSRLAYEGKVEPIVGRKAEIRRVERILRKKNKSNAILIGEPGVGKTAIAEAVALKWAKDDANVSNPRQIWSLDTNSLTAGTRYRGDLEERVKNILEYATKNGIILFIDEIHMLLKTDPIDPNSSMVANALKPALAKGLKVLGATTVKEYRSIFEHDEAFSRRFQKVEVEEPTVAEAIEIISKVINTFEKHHEISISMEAIETAVLMSKRYIPSRQLPDKAFDLIDEASAKLQETVGDGKELTAQHIEELVSEIVGLPVYSELKASDATKVNSNIEEHIIGQSEAVKVIHNAIKRHYAGLNDPNRPLASFIFAGPTGVGKTELAKTLAREVLKDESAFISLDMSEFGQEHTISKLIGSPPGYVGSDKGGILTEQVNKKPYSVILFDEIEKAHPDIYNVLLQVLEEGKLTDGTGRQINFRNTIIILTTNVGATQLTAGPLGFNTGTEENAYSVMKTKVISELKKNFRPELLNRFDDIVIFKQLTQANVLTILDSFIESLNQTVSKHNITVQFTEAAKKFIAEAGYDKTMGARPLRRTLQDKVEVELADWILNNPNPEKEHTLIVDYKDNKIAITNPDEIIKSKTKQTTK